MPTITTFLAARKGFRILQDSRLGLFRRVDNETKLPELNPQSDTFCFSLAEANEFLEPLHDRSRSLSSTRTGCWGGH